MNEVVVVSAIVLNFTVCLEKAGGGGGGGAAKIVKRPRQQPAHPQYANYWAPLTRKRHIPPDPAQPRHTNHWALRTRKRHQQEHRPQRPSERSDPTQHAKGRTGDCPGPCKGATTQRNVTRGVSGERPTGAASFKQQSTAGVMPTPPHPPSVTKKQRRSPVRGHAAFALPLSCVAWHSAPPPPRRSGGARSPRATTSRCQS